MDQEAPEETRMEKRQRAVPKFASFRPPPPVESGRETRPASEGGVASRDGEHRRQEDREREKDRDRREERRHRHRHSDRERERERRDGREDERRRGRGHEDRRDRERHRERERERDQDRDADWDRDREEKDRGRHARPPTNRVSPVLNHDTFAIDPHGDPLILQFGTNDRSKVPAYHRFGAGRVLGSRGFLAIHRDGAQELFTIRGPGDGATAGSAFRDKALVAAAARLDSRRIKPSPGRPPSAADDFIPLGPSRKRKRDDDDRDETAPPSPDYRSIHGKAKPSDFHSSDSDSDSDSPSTPPSPGQTTTPELSTTKTRAIQLTSHLKAHPTDLRAWLDLIALQDRLFAENHPTSAPAPDGPRPPAERRALAELKLALYRDALSHAASPPSPSPSPPRSADEEALLLGMMRQARAAWDDARVAREWDALRARHPPGAAAAGFALWRAWAGFELARPAPFALERARALLAERLALAGRALQTSAADAAVGDAAEDLCAQAVYVLLRLTRLLWDAGFGESAVAAWQAVLETVFCRPAREGAAAPEEALAAFAEFWESEVARVGEDGARGWRAFAEDGEDPAGVPEAGGAAPRGPPREAPGTADDPFEAWVAAEEDAADRARMPARTLDEGTEDDPFRVVLFSDIKDCIVWFPSAVLPLAKPMLVDAFLVFCGLPPAGLSGEKFHDLLGDPFVAGRAPGFDLSLGDDAGGRHISRREPEFGQQGGGMAVSPDLLFSGDSWFRYLDKRSSAHPDDRQVDASWVLKTLAYLVRDCGMESAAEFYLAMEWRHEPAGARKVAKGLLKQYSASVRLYNAYALIEWANGKPDVAHKVLSSAASLAPPAPGGNQLLWNTWAWICLDAGQKEAALARLCASVDREPPAATVSATQLLKARSQLSSARDYTLSSQQLGTAAQFAESTMLLEYLSPAGEPAPGRQGDIAAALASVQHFSQELDARRLASSPHHERLLQAAARLLYYHATHGPYQPSHLETHLAAFTRLFPRNALFLALRAWSQPAVRLDDPVRAALRELALAPPHDSLAARRLAIRHEARAGTAHSVRAALEAALDGAGAGSAELWARYVAFCCAHRELRARAREVFYRAVGACPWAKQVYLLAFRALRGVLSATELRAVGESMVVRGLRVHVELGEFLARWERRA